MTRKANKGINFEAWSAATGVNAEEIRAVWRELKRRGLVAAWIPAAVAVEVVLLRELGRISIGLQQLMSAMERAPSLRFLALDLPQLSEFAVHAGIRDPFDRLIIGACRTVGAKLVTKDRFLQKSGLVQTIWK